MSVVTFTLQEVLVKALKRGGIAASGQPVSGEDMNDAQDELHLMLGEWATGRFYAPALAEYSFVSTGASYYTIGPNGTAATVLERPSRIYSCFVRQLTNPGSASPGYGDFSGDFNADFSHQSPVILSPGLVNPSDYPLNIVTGKEQWDTIANKFAMSLPSHCFYDGAFPNGNLFFWPIPLPNVYELHVSFPNYIDTTTQLNQPLNVSSVTYAAIVWNLTTRLMAAWQMPEDSGVVKAASRSLRAMKRSNNHMPDMKMPPSLIRPGVYNPYSDQVR